MTEDKYLSEVQSSFERASDSYDNFSTALQFDVAERLCGLVTCVEESDLILDVGCGTGRVGKIIGRQGRLFQLDISKKMCSAAREKNRGLTVNCDASMIPFSDNTFNIVLSSMVMHWTSDIRTALSSMLRVLSVSGKGMFISVPVCGTLKELAISEKLLGGGLRFEFYEASFLVRLIISLGAKVEYMECKEMVLYHRTFLDFLYFIVNTGGTATKLPSSNRRNIMNVGRVYSRLFSRNGVLPSCWNIAYLVIKKKFC